VRIVAVAAGSNPRPARFGPRTKVAVGQHERKWIQVGACIGARGSRIRRWVNELRGEKIGTDPLCLPIPGPVLCQLTEPGPPVENGAAGGPRRPPRARAGANLDQLSLAIGRESERAASAAPPEPLEDRHQKMPGIRTRLPRMPKPLILIGLARGRRKNPSRS